MNLKNALLAISFLLANMYAQAQFCPPNIGFETGTLGGWEYFKGTVSRGPVYTLTPCLPTISFHTLMSGTGIDPLGGFPIVAPGGGSYSLKLGDNAVSAELAQRARCTIHVPAGDTIYSLVYFYAAVMYDAPHPAPEKPSMEIRVIDSATGKVIRCDSMLVTPSLSSGFSVSPVSSDVLFLPWTTVNINLEHAASRTVIVDVTTADCTHTGHWGYGYFDMACAYFSKKTILCGATTASLDAPPGYAAYRWCDAATMSVTISTLQNAVITAPTVPTKYAVILTPAGGLGCVDTLYTEVVPLTPCSGLLGPGSPVAARSGNCTDPDTLVVPGFAATCGLTFQWQSSPDNAAWTDIAGATTDRFPYHSSSVSLYYRCLVTCTASGLSAFSGAIFVAGATGIRLTSVTVPPDTVCSGVKFHVAACDTSSTLSVASFYGDGTFDIVALSSSGVPFADFTHHYAFPGTYTVKQVLYDGTSAVDSVVFSYTYMFCSTLPVKFYFDRDNDCVKDADERNFLPVLTEVDSMGIPVDTISATSGFYYVAHGGPGTIYTFRVLPDTSGVFVSCPSSGILLDTIQPLVNKYKPKYFGLSISPGAADFDLQVYPSMMYGVHAARGSILVQNTMAMVVAPRASVNFSPKYQFGSATPNIASQVGTQLTWDVRPISTVTDAPELIEFYLNTSGPTYTPGDTFYSANMVNPQEGDMDTTNNMVVRCDTLRTSYDPNYIDVNPQGCLPDNAAVHDLRYTIHFENTGNDTAFNIHVMDTLSDNLDPRTLVVKAASAQMDIVMSDVAGRNVVKFDFPGINLLDSSHHGQCHGMFVYDIKTKPGLAKGSSIQNRVGIFFDYNDVVLTNTVENIIGCPTLKVTEVARSVAAQIYPNPATDELIIKMTKDAYTSFTITNQIGQVLIEQQTNTSQTKVDIKTLAPGLYYITLKGENGTSVQKFVKL